MDNRAEEWLTDLRPEDLPEPYRRMADLIGVEHAVVVAREYAGSSIYLPKLDSALRAIRDRRIRSEFTGYNVRELARRYDLTEEWVRRIAAADHDNGQVDIFDLLGSNQQAG